MAAVRATPRSSPGMRCSSRSLDGLARVERGEDGLDGDATARDELTARAAERRGDGRRPAVLPHEHGGDSPGLERAGGLFEIVLAQQARRRALEFGEALARLRDLADVDRDHGPVALLGHERDVE